MQRRPPLHDQPRRVAVIGAGGHAVSVSNFLGDLGHCVVGLLDEDPALFGTQVAGHQVLGPPAMLPEMDIDATIVAIGDNVVRKRLYDYAVDWDVPFISVIHPAAYVAQDAQLGRGVVVMPMAAVNTGAVVGDNAIVSLHAAVSHESHVGAHCHISANACLCGRVTVHDGAFVGAGATVIPLKHVGEWTTIGAGSTVIGDIPGHVVAVGTPARVLRRLRH